MQSNYTHNYASIWAQTPENISARSLQRCPFAREYSLWHFLQQSHAAASQMFVFKSGDDGVRPRAKRRDVAGRRRSGEIHTRRPRCTWTAEICMSLFYFHTDAKKKLGHSHRQLKLNAVQFFTAFPLLNLAPPPTHPFPRRSLFCSSEDQ